MYTIINGNKEQTLSAYEDHKEIGGIMRPCVHICFKGNIQVDTLVNTPLAIYADDGSLVRQFDPCDSVASYEVTLYRQSEIEKQLKQVKAELEVVKAERDELKKAKS